MAKKLSSQICKHSMLRKEGRNGKAHRATGNQAHSVLAELAAVAVAENGAKGRQRLRVVRGTAGGAAQRDLVGRAVAEQHQYS